MRKTGKKFMGLLFLIYIMILLRITVFRPGVSLANLMQNGTVNLTLFQSYIPLIQQGRWIRFIYLFVGNIVWFVPLGFGLLASGKVRKVRTVLLCGLGLSLFIELLQYILGTGISELDDLVLNTLGTWMGAATVQTYRHFQGRRKKNND